MKKELKWCISVLVLGIVVLCLWFSIKMLPAGYAGVVFNPLKGGVSKTRVLDAGLNFKAPWEKVIRYTISTEQQYLSADPKSGSKDDESFQAVTKDGKTVKVSIDYALRFDRDHLPNIAERFRLQSGKSILHSYVRGKMITYVQEAISEFTVLELYGEKKQAANARIFKHSKEKFNKDFIIIESANLTGIKVDAATERAIQQRITAQQELEKEKIERDKAVIISEKLKIQSEGRAKAEAAYLVIKAEGRAKSNKLVSDSITDKLLRDKELDRWNGQRENTTLVQGGNAIVGNN